MVKIVKMLEVKTHKQLEDLMEMWVSPEEREIVSANINLTVEMVEKLSGNTESPEMRKEIAHIIGRLVSMEKALDGLNEIVLLY